MAKSKSETTYYVGVYPHGSNYGLGIWKSRDELQEFDADKSLFYMLANNIEELMLMLLRQRKKGNDTGEHTEICGNISLFHYDGGYECFVSETKLDGEDDISKVMNFLGIGAVVFNKK